MFAALLHMPLSRAEYEDLTQLEREEFLKLCREINKANGGK